MEQDNIYRVLLELKETAGSVDAKLDDVKEAIVKQSIAHDKLKESHDELKASHNNLKGKVLWISGAVGTIFGAFTAWLKLEWTKLFG